MSVADAAPRSRSSRARLRYLFAAVAAAVTLLGSVFVFLSPAEAQQGGFRVQGRNLVDANGNVFVMRGSTHPEVWYESQNNAIRDMSNLGANTVRVVLGSGHRGWGTSTQAEVAAVVAECKQYKVVCVLELHDTTGYGDQAGAATLAQAVQYWNSVKGALVGQERYVLINIGNEPLGNNSASQWTSATSSAIQGMRSNGFTHTLVVDAPNWGQDWSNTMRNNAPQVFNADSQRNTVFSVHMYEVYTSGSTVTSYFNAFQQMNLPLIVGEYGNVHAGQSVAWQTIQSEAQARGIGWIAWSWSGDGVGLDQVSNFNPSQMTQWGQQVFNSQYGIRNTAKRASVYESGGPATSPPPGDGDQIVGGASSRCVEVSSATNGTQARLWDCNGSANQAWTRSATGELKVNGKCLDAEGWGTSNGTKAVLWDCSGGNNQRWNVNANGTITNVHNGLCLDANNAGTANGTPIILWTCNGGSNQRWTLR
jgi:mannan endo-1,4-beta-mannosidase